MGDPSLCKLCFLVFWIDGVSCISFYGFTAPSEGVKLDTINIVCNCCSAQKMGPISGRKKISRMEIVSNFIASSVGVNGRVHRYMRNLCFGE